VTPKRLKEKLLGAMQYYAYKDRSIFEIVLKQEIKDGSRLVYENAGFVSHCRLRRGSLRGDDHAAAAIGVLPGHPPRRILLLAMR